MQTSYEKHVKPVKRENVKREYTQSKAHKGLQRDKLREAKRSNWS